MGSLKIVFGLGLLLAIIVSGCAGTSDLRGKKSSFVANIINQPMDFVEPEADMLWEGEISGDRVGYYRLKVNSHYKDVVVITHDKLPGAFRRIEYCDKDGDNKLDVISIKMYRKNKGWNNVMITKENEITLKHADNKYNEILEKIRDLRMKQINY